MRTLALPASTRTAGLPAASSETVTSGLFAGGCGGSRTSVVTVPASANDADQHPAAGDLDGAGRNRTGEGHDGPLAVLGKAVRNGQPVPSPQGSPSAPSHTASMMRIPEQWSMERQPSESLLAVSMAFSRASSRESRPQRVTVLA